MIRLTRLAIRRTMCLVSALALTSASCPIDAADQGRIRQSIESAQQFLLKERLSGPQGSVAILAYIKSGGDKQAPVVDPVVQEVLRKVREGTYVPNQFHTYEAGVDLMLLESIDSVTHRPAMEAITAYLLRNQQPNGSWFYPENLYHNEPDCGDTSITQYALLGLWAAWRNGIEVPIDVWEKAARWHIAKQREDGGFAYNPFDRKSNPSLELRQSSGTMSAAGSSNLLIIRRVLFNDADMDAEVRPAESKKRFGVLERFVDDKSGPKPNVPAVVTLRPGAIDKSLKESIRWISNHFGEKNPNHQEWFAYHFYCIERVAALMDVEKFGTHDWYDEGADELLIRQLPNGSWTDHCTPVASTALGLMFLSKATTTIVAPKKRVSLVGGGLQAGGRGLPDNLGSVQVKEGTVSARKLVGPVDTLLIELERSADARVLDIQAAVIEAVQLDRPEELIGQTVRLRKLAGDTRSEVRRTALWGLGRSGDISVAPLLIRALADPDQSVMREASRALCILSRRPEGCGKPVDPFDDPEEGLKEGMTDEQRNARLADWQTESQKRWLDWYQKIRPYDERDDRTTLKRTSK
jgi:hypothetical protein